MFTKKYFQYYLKWISLAALIGVCAGVASAFFLFALEHATEYRNAHPWLLFLLPIGGLMVGLLYHCYGREVEGGNNLILDEFHDPKSVIPFRMAPLVLIGTVVTHFFGGSAGREGTAVQMGGSISDQLGRYFKIQNLERRTLLMAGMAGGFGSVFGVPFAGTIFGLEVLSIGKLEWEAIIECAVAAFVAHFVTLACGTHHTAYRHPVVEINSLASTVFFAILCGVIFGGASRIFAITTDRIKLASKKLIPLLPLRAFCGGALVSLLYLLIPFTTRYAGLGVPLIVQSLQSPVLPYDWLGKLVLTALTLGLGFKGGEVTPLLFVGAALGNALSLFIPVPLPLLAGMGFVAVFAGAANTPIACTLMAFELFGSQVGIFSGIACFASFMVSGHHGIYHAQRVHLPKTKFASRTIELVSSLFEKSPKHKG